MLTAAVNYLDKGYTMDRTYLTVRKQLVAMGAGSFDIGVKSSQTGSMINKVLNQSGVLKLLPWLRRENQSGAHIYIRPTESSGLVLLDDLSITKLGELEHAGLAPTCVVETSPLNYQAWVRVSDGPIAAGLATAVCQVLAIAFNADLNSADWRHYGRLAGFTNRKPEYVADSGQYPFVLLRQSQRNRRVAENAGEWLSRASDHLAARENEARSANQITLIQPGRDGLLLPDPLEFYRSELSGLVRKYGQNLDESRADWMIVRKMAARGFERAQIREAVESESPNLEERKKGHVSKYVELTLDQAIGKAG